MLIPYLQEDMKWIIEALRSDAEFLVNARNELWKKKEHKSSYYFQLLRFQEWVSENPLKNAQTSWTVSSKCSISRETFKDIDYKKKACYMEYYFDIDKEIF